MVIEKLHARNGVTLQEPDKMTVTVMPGEELEVGLHAYIGPSQLDYKLFNRIDSSTVTFVYAYYPYRQRLVLINEDNMEGRNEGIQNNTMFFPYGCVVRMYNAVHRGC